MVVFGLIRHLGGHGVPYPNNGGLVGLAVALSAVVVGSGGFRGSNLVTGGWTRGPSLATGGWARGCGLLGVRARCVGPGVGLGLGLGLGVALAVLRDAHGDVRGVRGAASKPV